jgi:hypothetical protein
MSARPHHLRLVVANEEASRASRTGAFAWSTATLELAPAAGSLSAAPHDDARAGLLQSAALRVLASPVSVAHELVSSKAIQGSPRGSSNGFDLHARARRLVLDTEQVGLLEELALLRRARTFVDQGAPALEELERSPRVGASHVRRLLGGERAHESEGAVPPSTSSPTRGRPGGGALVRHRVAALLMAAALAAWVVVRRTFSFL